MWGSSQHGHKRVQMQVADFPRSLRAMFAVFLILFFFNALYALAFLTAIWTWRIDPGVAILIGTLGVCILGWVGIATLIRSQEHRAVLDMEARQHQHTLDLDREGKRIDENRALLMAALRAEITGLMHRAEDAIQFSNIMQSWLQEMIAAKAPNSPASFKWPTFKAPVYQANVSNVGLLGASLGADVVSVMTGTGIIDPPATINRPISNEVVAKLYAGLETAMREWREDLYHVTLRIRAREEGTSDPGTLLEAQIKGKQEKEKDERDIAASIPPVPRTKRQQEKVKKERIVE
jgi:hypothetical protein